METYNKLPKIVEYLAKEKKAAPSAIASHIKSDIRTTNKMLCSLSNLKLIKSESLNTGKRTYLSYSLAKEENKQNGGNQDV